MDIDYNHGVHYTPSNTQLTTNLTVESLKDLGISYICLQWVDFINNVRYRVLPLSYFQKVLKSSRPGVALTKASLGLVYLTMADGFTPMEEYLYVPDLSSLRICSYEKGQAVIMGWFQEKTPIPQGPNGTLSFAVDLCPRGILQRVVDDARTKAGVEFLVGIETEFILLKSTSPIVASNIHSWSRSEGLFTGNVESMIMREIADCLLEAGIELQMYHAEAAPGQYEIVTGPLQPLQAADATVFTRETISNIASKHGLHATFAPRIFPDSTGSAAHAHISVHPASNNNNNSPAKSPHHLSTHESSFLSGVLTHLPAIAALTLPIPASYGRVTDGAWSGGTYVCWGTENREAPVRLTNASSPSSRNFECRFIDATASPYLALAAILGAGAEGVKNGAVLVEKDVGSEGKTAAQMSEEERKKYGIRGRLSLNWKDARVKFKEDRVMNGVFGDHFVEKYLAVNKQLAECLAQDKDEVKALERLAKFY